MAIATFDSTKVLLVDILRDVNCGKIQLPDFQRGWVWDDQGIRSLLESISQSFPIGAIMMLEAGGEVRFQPHPIEGVPAENLTSSLENLVLDGQQRITSLYQACFRDKPVETMDERRRKVLRWYYIDIEKALEPAVDMEEAIVGLPENKKVTRDFGREVVYDLSTPELEYQNLMFPVNKIFDFYSWQNGFFQFWDYDREKIKQFQQFHQSIIMTFQTYQVPVIILGKETSKEAVCLVFEKVNTGGKKLDAFELLTATYAADNFNLRKDWFGDQENGVEGRMHRLAKFNVLKNIASTDFLQSISLLHTHEYRESLKAQGITNPKELPPVSCNRKAILDLPLHAYKKWADRVEEGFKRAAKFLTLQKVFWFKDIPYQTQLVPLAAILVQLGDRWEEDGVRRKLAQWFWCGVFGELYGSAVETRFAKDFVEVPAFIEGGPLPSTIIDASLSPDRLRSLRSRLSAAYKGINALLKREGALDFRSGQPFEYTNFWDENVDIHHIFPRSWCSKQGIPRALYDSVVNKSPLSSRTNRIIGGHPPSIYLPILQKEAGISAERMDFILRSHLIEPDLLRADDFYKFFERRAEKLLELIEKAMGKSLSRVADQVEGDEIIEEEEELVENIESEEPVTP